MPNVHLPEKTCPVCRRPFKWRKKWERDWDRVKYCSKRCAAAARRGSYTDADTRTSSPEPES